VTKLSTGPAATVEANGEGLSLLTIKGGDWSGTGTPASDRAKMLSEKLRVPAKLRGKGEVSLGPLAKCGCGIATPMRYGGKALCPVCARR